MYMHMYMCMYVHVACVSSVCGLWRDTIVACVESPLATAPAGM